MTCERCGKEIPDNIAICPNCGTVTSAAPGKPKPTTKFGPYSGGYVDGPPITEYGQGYAPQQGYPPPLQEYRPPQQAYGYGQPYNAPPMYQPAIVNVNIVNPASTTNNTPVIVEVLLSLFLGIYGVGWLMAGETTTGIILLICSILLYWPILITITIFTFGLGLFCLGPLAIGAIILNAVLLNNKLKQKAASFTPIPPR